MMPALTRIEQGKAASASTPGDDAASRSEFHRVSWPTSALDESGTTQPLLAALCERDLNWVLAHARTLEAAYHGEGGPACSKKAHSLAAHEATARLPRPERTNRSARGAPIRAVRVAPLTLSERDVTLDVELYVMLRTVSSTCFNLIRAVV